MKHTIILLIIVFLSCTKEEQCKTYNLITESSENSARQKCNGIANSHPEYKELTKTYIGCLTTSELKEAKKAESTITKTYCNGVTFQIRTIVR